MRKRALTSNAKMVVWLLAVSILLPVLLLSLIWLPELNHFYVPGVTITPAMLEGGRQQPADGVLEELRAHRLLPRRWQSDQQLISIAEKLLHGRVEIPGYAVMKIGLPFDPADLERGSGMWQLQFAGLIVPEILLDAYQLTGREEFYAAARDIILAWARCESGAWLDHGFLWNDHAVAARVLTLADFWRVYRHRRDYDAGLARVIWGFAARTGRLLAKPDQFTVATNHGVMQNLALWQLCLAFPSLPQVEEYKQLALTRLKYQMAFYAGADGVILEHSAEYQEFGLHLLSLALRYATLLDLDVPPDWPVKYKKAQDFYAEIRRPDGSLPMFGDTSDVKRPEGVPVVEPDARGRTGPLAFASAWRPRAPFGLYPVAGYAILWDGLHNWPSPQSQTVMIWAHHPGHGHKHADELSVLLWAGGRTWWTNSGYWPYDDADRSHAECWEGSNAPHLFGEGCYESRTAALISSYLSESFSAVEMKRRGPDDFVARRQVVHVAPDLWVVADNSSGGAQKIQHTIWTTLPNVDVRRAASANAFTLSAEGLRQQLRAFFFGPPGMKTDSLRGSRTPFAGWVSTDGKGQPTTAILAEQPAEGAWCVTVWMLQEEGPHTRRLELPPAVVKWSDAQNWSIRIPQDPRSREISRAGEMISVREVKSGTPVVVRASLEPPPPDTARQIEELGAAFHTASSRYPRIRDLTSYRLRASALVLGLLLLQELFLAGYRRVDGKHSLVLRGLAVLCWVGLGACVLLFYLRAS